MLIPERIPISLVPNRQIKSIPLQSPCNKDHHQRKGKPQPDDDPIAKPLRQGGNKRDFRGHRETDDIDSKTGQADQASRILDVFPQSQAQRQSGSKSTCNQLKKPSRQQGATASYTLPQTHPAPELLRPRSLKPVRNPEHPDQHR